MCVNRKQQIVAGMPCFYALKLVQVRLKTPHLVDVIWKLACGMEMREVAAEVRSYPDAVERAFLQCSTRPSSHDFIERLKECHEVHCSLDAPYDLYMFILALDDNHFVIVEDQYESGCHWYESSTLLECFVHRDGDQVVAKFGRYYYQYIDSYADHAKTYYTLEERLEVDSFRSCVDLFALRTVADRMGGDGAAEMTFCTTLAGGKKWLYPDVVREGLCPNRHPPEGVFFKPMFGPRFVDEREFDLGEGHPDRPGGHGDFIV